MQALVQITHFGETTGPRRTAVLATDPSFIQAMCNPTVGDNAEKIYSAIRRTTKRLNAGNEVMMNRGEERGESTWRPRAHPYQRSVPVHPSGAEIDPMEGDEQIRAAAHELIENDRLDDDMEPLEAEEGPEEEQQPPPEEMDLDPEGTDQDDLLGAKAITFKGKVAPAVKTALRRLHQNLGHPRNEDLARNLKLGGASQQVQEACKHLRCQTCLREKNRPVQRPAKLPAHGDFNDSVGMDIIHIYDAEQVRYLALSIVDLNTTYQVVTLVEDTKAETIKQAFGRTWVDWAGPPKHVHLDMDSGFKAEFQEALNFWAARTTLVAGQAPWQHGVTERQGGWWKEIWKRTVNHENITTKEDVMSAIPCVSQAKNDLRRKAGYSPSQWVLGKLPRLPDCLIDASGNLATHSEILESDALARRIAIRTAARKAFCEAQSDQAIRRALVHRNRVKPREYEQGDLVFVFREYRTGQNKSKRGIWRGPSIVIGKEGGNYWVSQNGRCVLCAREHLRPALGEEIGEVFDRDIFGKDMQALLEALETDSQPEYEDLTSPPNRPTRRLRRKTTLPLGAGLDAEIEDPAEAAEVLMIKHKLTERTKRKQLEKEIPWNQIPEHQRQLYKEAADKQWDEHLKYEAVEVKGLRESQEIRSKIDPRRVLRSRFAYRDKNAGMRTRQRDIPVKAKARLCCGGHLDPDLDSGLLRTDAPTVARVSLMAFLNISQMLGLSPETADITAAFLNGERAERQLYMEQPREGLPGMVPGQLIEIIKGVFGLATSPRLWWKKLAQSLLEEVYHDQYGEEIQFVQHRLDPCLFLLRDSQGELIALLATHVDDLKLACRKNYLEVKYRIQERFPIGDWEQLPYTYTGSQYIREDNGDLIVSQEAYVDQRLEPFKVTRGRYDEDKAEWEETADNQSAIGGVSWLSSQTRPDLACGCSFAQKKQKAPTVRDLKATSKLLREAQNYKDTSIRIQALNPDDLCLVVYHDAAWANTTTQEEVEEPNQEMIDNKEVYSQIGYLIFLCESKVARGEEGRANLLDWKAHACPRVCRSTFAGETMAAAEAMDAAIALRALLLEAMHPHVDLRDIDPSMLPITAVTDCKSLYDTIHKEGLAKAPSEKRLIVDLASLRQVFMLETPESGPVEARTTPLKWVPTHRMLADCMTKVMKGDALRQVLVSGKLKI
jgi:hypothetical protein